MSKEYASMQWKLEQAVSMPSLFRRVQYAMITDRRKVTTK